MKAARLKSAFVAFWLLHGVVLTAVYGFVYQGRGLDAGIGRLGFHLDGLVRSLLESGTYGAIDQDGLWFTAHRMPIVPGLVSAILCISSNYLVAHLIKALVVNGVMCVGFYLFFVTSELRVRWRLSVIAFFMFSPQIQMQQMTMATEEGWLLSPLVLVSVLLAGKLQTRQPWLLVVFPALFYLTKSSLLVFSVFLCLSIFRRLRPAGGMVSVALLLAAILAWGAWTNHNGGGFRTGTTLDGWNLYKGNNPLTMTVYPFGSLDVLADRNLLLVEGAPETEWEWDATFKRMAADHIAGNPSQTALSVTARVFNLYINVWNPPRDFRASTVFLWVLSMLWMILFRVGFACCLVREFRAVFRGVRCGRVGANALSLIFLGLVAGYSAPYLIGFAYDRHALALAAIALISVMNPVHQIPRERLTPPP